MLTEKGVQALRIEKGRREVAVGGAEGLWLRVSPKRKSWVFRFRLEGRTRRLSFGVWPAMGLKEARTEAVAARARVLRGEDPGAPSPVVETATTLGEVAEIFARQELPALAASTSREYRRLLEREILPTLGAMGVSELDLRHHVTPWLDELRARGPVLHNRARSLLSRLLRFAAGRGLEVRCQVGLTPLVPERPRQRWLTQEELREVMPALAQQRGVTGLVLRMILLTGQRVSEVCRLRWDQESRPGIWELSVTKNGDPHVVPILPMAASVMARGRGLDPVLIFPGPKGILPVSSISTAAARICAGLGWSGKHAWTPRDLRRTAATHLAGLGVAPHILDHILNHRPPGVRGVYDHHLYLEEKTQALANWEARLASLQPEDISRFAANESTG